MKVTGNHYLVSQFTAEEVLEKSCNSAGLNKHITFNIASWLNMAGPVSGAVKLKLRIKDAKKDHMITVDKASQVSAGQLLLSGQVSAKLQGKLQVIQLLACCETDKLQFKVDSTFVQQAAERPSANRPKALLYAVA